MNLTLTEPDGTTTKINEPGPTLDADQLAANKAFVATVNAHFGVTKLRELASQEDRAQAVEWGLARAEDGEFEIPGDDEDEDAI